MIKGCLDCYIIEDIIEESITCPECHSPRFLSIIELMNFYNDSTGIQLEEELNFEETRNND